MNLDVYLKSFCEQTTTILLLLLLCVLLINVLRPKAEITDDGRKIKLANPGHRAEINLYCRGFGCYSKITYLWVNKSIINSTDHTQSTTVIIGGDVKIAG